MREAAVGQVGSVTGIPDEGRRYSLLLISHTYPPVLGGSEIEAQRVCSALMRRGHRVTVLCAGGPPMPDVPEFIDPEGVPVRVFGRGTARFRDYAFALGVVRTLIRERNRYQIVYFLMQGIHLAAGLPVARALRKPIVMKVSGSGIITSMREVWMGRLELKLLGKWARRVMILNPGIEQEAARAGLPPERLLWMPNPVDTDQFAPCSPEVRPGLRARLGLLPDAPVVLFVGRLAPEKELPSLIRAFAVVLSQRRDARLVLIGDGALRADLEALAAGLNIAGSIRFAGRQTVPEVVEWLQAGDIFALVSSNEGFPCSLVEAMSAGLPSVVSDIPGNVQVIKSGVHGLLAPAGDPDSIARALLELITDRRARTVMGSAARRVVLNEYSMQKVADRYEALFAEAIGQC